MEDRYQPHTRTCRASPDNNEWFDMDQPNRLESYPCSSPDRKIVVHHWKEGNSATGILDLDAVNLSFSWSSSASHHNLKPSVVDHELRAQFLLVTLCFILLLYITLLNPLVKLLLKFCVLSDGVCLSATWPVLKGWFSPLSSHVIEFQYAVRSSSGFSSTSRCCLEEFSSIECREQNSSHESTQSLKSCTCSFGYQCGRGSH